MIDGSLKRSALVLAAAGWPVFPCGPDKAPRVPTGFKAATLDPDVIEDWAVAWAVEGAMLGAALPPGVVVIDIDPRNGGAETWNAVIEGRHDEGAATRTVRTRSGGLHFYFAVPDDVELRATLGPGIDVKRAGKGYVIVPPSAGYVFERGGDPAPMPQWLLDELVVTPRDGAVDEAHAPKFHPWDKGTTYGLRALDAELAELRGTGEGGRNAALNSAAFSLAQLAEGGELDGDHAQAELLDAAAYLGLGSGETAATVRSGWEAGSQRPRQAPERDAAPSAPAAPRAPSPRAAEDALDLWPDVNWNVDEPDPPFYLHPVIPRNAYVMVYGAAASSKSMCFLGLLAEGSHRGLKCSVFSLENPSSTERFRLRKLRPHPENFRLTTGMLDLSNPSHFAALVAREKAFGTDLLMIDTYSHAFGMETDNGNAKAIAFAVLIRRLMEEVGCSVILLDHSGFGDSGEMRDASAKRQQADVAVWMRPAGDWLPGQDSQFLMENRKWSRFGNPFNFKGVVRDMPDGSIGLIWVGGHDKPEWRV